MQNLKDLPFDLKKFLRNRTFKEDKIGCSDANIYLLKSSKDKENFYLKTGLTGTLEREKNILDWLKDKLPVPEVLYYSKAERDYLLIEEIKGMDLVKESSYLNPEKVVFLIAEGLCMIHKVDISKCPFNMRLAVKLNEAKNLVEKELVGRENFEPENLQKSPQEIYQELLASIPKSENLVFTHGDYCLPNIIIKKGKINGFVDLGRGGVADRYQDIALAVRSIRHNLKSEKFVELFLDAYGLKNVDFSKIDYYILLDELF